NFVWLHSEVLTSAWTKENIHSGNIVFPSGLNLCVQRFHLLQDTFYIPLITFPFLALEKCLEEKTFPDWITCPCVPRDEFNLDVLQAFVELHEFADLNLVQALRQFLWSFRLPGEAQKIDRMMEAFASRYCGCNPGVFQSTDTCYVLSFAIIMLNTSLHNPNVRDKPPVERFISMNRGINEGGDLPEELLRNLFDSIKKEPFKIPEDDGNDLTHTFFNPDREGWLLKLGGRVKTWKRRWFILTDNCLYYFEYTTDKEPRGIIPLENLSIRDVDEPRKPNCFELYNPNHKGSLIKACKTEADGRVVEGNHTVYRISAPTTEEKEEWIKSIKASISRDPFYDMLATRKRRIANKK
uniref:Cytohesin 3 n=1 Tax=Hucho hucho TaxID=62062 RepID=A0A4W5Q5V2_9TELE